MIKSGNKIEKSKRITPNYRDYFRYMGEVFMLNQELVLSTIYKEDKESVLFNQLPHFFKTHFQSFLSAMGYGVVVNSGGNLSPYIIETISSSKNKTVSFESGTFIDKKGRVIVLPESLSVSFNIDEFDGKTIYFYLKGIETLEEKVEHPGRFFIQETLLKGEISLSAEKKISTNNDYIELCRISIDGDNLSHPTNPFNPKKNELDIRFVPRVLSNNSLASETIDKISLYLTDYASFFTELASRVDASTTILVASEAFQSASRVRFNSFSTFEVYAMLSQLVRVTLFFYAEVKDKIEDIENGDFRRSLSRLESIFFSEESLNEGSVKFYDLDLEENRDKKNFWENIFAHIHDISHSQDAWKPIIQHDEILNVKKDYLLLGRLGGENLDIEIDYDYISGNHLKITKNDINPELLDIEDLGSSNGTYFQGVRYEEYKKVTVHKNAKIELHDYEFDIYNNPVVKDFLAN